MSEENVLKAEKIKKLKKLKSLGLNPFAHNYKPNTTSKVLNEEHKKLLSGESIKEKKVILAGRLMTLRKMGKASFFHIQDREGQIQAYIVPKDLSQKAQDFFKYLDIGDIVGVEGFVFRTRKGELSVYCEDFIILCKSIETLPEKFHGIIDTEVRYRQRHLDLIMNPDVKKVFQMRSYIIKEIRAYLDKEDFLEVQTPALQPLYGGASAEPFQTYHKALNMNLFLKISPELYLKRLVVGGLDKVYELGVNFRNEGMDRTHNPEFTMLEYYEAYTDYQDQMKRFEELCASVIQKIKGSLKFPYQDREIDFTIPWTRMSLKEAIRKYGDFCVDSMDEASLSKKLQSLGSDKEDFSLKGEMIVEAFELCAEQNIWNPTFIYDFPVEVSPLTKVHRKDHSLVERFEPIVAGMELGNSYTELNDPLEQREKMQKQKKWTSVEGRGKKTTLDEDFLHALEMGLPPTGGVGLGIERLVMILTNSSSIRDILFFPAMKTKDTGLYPKDESFKDTLPVK